MINFFDKLYSAIQDRNQFLKKIRFYSALRFAIRVTANFILPFYFKITQSNKSFRLNLDNNSEKLIIVSLTTFPARINKLWIVIETLLRQKEKPDRIILWLSEMQFQSIKNVPKELVKLQKRGLAIRFCPDDLRSHKKYYYVMKEFPNDCIITVDDDVIYNTNLLSSLISLNNEFPKSVCCNHASYITINNGDVDKYVNWKTVQAKNNPTYSFMPIGVGGILYPPNSLHKDVFNKDVFMKKCMLADDIWLNIMSRINDTKAAKTNFNSKYLPILYLKNRTLNSENVNMGLNDQQLMSVRDYYINNINIDPFKNILE